MTIANRFTPLEQFPALSCEIDDEIRVVGNPYDLEGIKRQTEILGPGKIKNFGHKRRDVSWDSDKSYFFLDKKAEY